VYRGEKKDQEYIFGFKIREKKKKRKGGGGERIRERGDETGSLAGMEIVIPHGKKKMVRDIRVVGSGVEV